MALQMNVTTSAPLNFVVKDAYVRIEQVRHNRFEDGMECVARCYQSNPGFPPNQPAFRDIVFRAPFDLNGADPYTQGYTGAKALEEFACAVDC
jgi:hypothetical protein